MRTTAEVELVVVAAVMVQSSKFRNLQNGENWWSVKNGAKIFLKF
jgi:hypothetical protein